MGRDGFVNTLHEIFVVAVLGFKQEILRRLRSASSAQNARVVWSEVNTDGRDLVSPMTAISLSASCSMGCTNW